MTTKEGFTFIEVMVAMLIFTLAVATAITIVNGSVRATRDAREMTTAAWLLQTIMTELETKIETDGFEKGCEKKKEARFESPHEKFSWTAFCSEIDFNLAQAATQLSGKTENEEEPEKKEDVIQKLILQLANDYLGKSVRELHAEIAWLEGSRKRLISASTHVVTLDQPLLLPSFGTKQ